MKKSVPCFMFVMLAVWQCFAGGIQIGLTEGQKEIPADEWGAVTYNTQISIGFQSNAKEFRTNQVGELLVRIKNLSTNEYGVGVQTPFALNEDFSFVIISPSGKDISPVFHDTSFRFSGGMVWVHPNQIDGFGFQLDEICKTDEIGTYKIILKMKRATPDRHKSFEIVSNPLSVAIVADKPMQH